MKWNKKCWITYSRLLTMRNNILGISWDLLSCWIKLRKMIPFISNFDPILRKCSEMAKTCTKLFSKSKVNLILKARKTNCLSISMRIIGSYSFLIILSQRLYKYKFYCRKKWKKSILQRLSKSCWWLWYWPTNVMRKYKFRSKINLIIKIFALFYVSYKFNHYPINFKKRLNTVNEFLIIDFLTTYSLTNSIKISSSKTFFPKFAEWSKTIAFPRTKATKKTTSRTVF